MMSQTLSVPIVRRLRGDHISQSPQRRSTVSVIIPCFNYARFLPGAIASALDQRDVDIDVIVVDDSSSDGSLAVARRIARDDVRVQVIAHAHNLGPVAAFNDGLAVASGEFLIRLDADDLLTPGSVARSVALAEEHPQVGMVYGYPVPFSGSAPASHRDRAKFWDIWSGASWLERRCQLGVNCITSPEVLMRASVVDRVGGQRALAHTHDMEMWFRLARDSDVGWVGGCDQALHREHPDSLSARQVDVMTDFHERVDAFRLLFEDGMGEVSENARLFRLARMALANEALSRTVSAYAKGRGATSESEGYLSFARGLGVDLGELRAAASFARAERLGPVRSRRSPQLLGWAAIYRLTRELGGPVRQSRGL